MNQFLFRHKSNTTFEFFFLTHQVIRRFLRLKFKIVIRKSGKGNCFAEDSKGKQNQSRFLFVQS